MRGALALAAVVVVGLLPGTPIATSHAKPSYLDCLQPVPDTKAMQAFAADPTTTVADVDVQILLDEIPRALAVEYMTEVTQIYAALGIRMRVAYRTVKFKALPDDTYEVGVAALIEQARALYGGERPSGVEVVHVLSVHKYGGGTSDCVGGVRYPERGFSAAQATWEFPQMFAPVPVRTVAHASALLHAHEIGHTLGGHHHFGNCVQGVTPSDVTGGPELSHCTVMASGAHGAPMWAQSHEFDSINAVIIRGHALAYAS